MWLFDFELFEFLLLLGFLMCDVVIDVLGCGVGFDVV